MKTTASTVILSLLLLSAGAQAQNMDFLIGTWKVEDRELYEVWEKKGTNDFNGYSYRLENGEKIITETLSIKRINNRMIYAATVPDQNEGQTIRFQLNGELASTLSFENAEPDFPKKIHYKKLNDKEIEVTVLGDEGKGFSMRLQKQTIK